MSHPLSCQKLSDSNEEFTFGYEAVWVGTVLSYLNPAFVGIVKGGSNRIRSPIWTINEDNNNKWY